ncbi:lytic transglycosylase domain-containing protein [Aquamicrobium sp. LC103]|nr:lytic transglycosylase domain-containing protein [Aquamicrobium sp. LC103]
MRAIWEKTGKAQQAKENNKTKPSAQKETQASAKPAASPQANWHKVNEYNSVATYPARTAPVAEVAEKAKAPAARSKAPAAKAEKTAKAPKVTARARKSTSKRGVDKTTTASVAAKKGSDLPASTKAKAASLAGGTRYQTIVTKYASAHGISPALAHAVIRVESNYRQDARGQAGEIGLMQIKPATARMLGYSGSVKGLYDPDTNIRYGMKYLAMAQELGGGSTCGTILKYNAGHAAKRMNKISAAYCAKVKQHMGK